jgi:hypothetical protein
VILNNPVFATNNPYRSPEITEEVFESGGSSGCWRDGNRLVVTRDALLPQLCVKCGRPGSPGRVRKIDFRPKEFGKLLWGILICAPLCVGLLIAWPLSVHIGYAAIPILGILIGVLAYACIKQEPPERIELTFSFCSFHGRLQHGRWIIGFGWLLLFVVLISLERLGMNITSPVISIYLPGMIINILFGSMCFMPTGERYDGTKYYYIKGCGKSYLQTLPAMKENVSL